MSAKLHWTKGHPDSPGWYWFEIKYDNTTNECLAYFERLPDGKKNLSIYLYNTITGEIDESNVEQENILRWADPIEKPIEGETHD